MSEESESISSTQVLKAVLPVVIKRKCCFLSRRTDAEELFVVLTENVLVVYTKFVFE